MRSLAATTTLSCRCGDLDAPCEACPPPAPLRVVHNDADDNLERGTVRIHASAHPHVPRILEAARVSGIVAEEAAGPVVVADLTTWVGAALVFETLAGGLRDRFAPGSSAAPVDLLNAARIAGLTSLADTWTRLYRHRVNVDPLDALALNVDVSAATPGFAAGWAEGISAVAARRTLRDTPPPFAPAPDPDRDLGRWAGLLAAARVSQAPL